MKKLDLAHIEQQLKHRWEYKYVWKRKQNNLWDSYTSYIYETQDWSDLIPKMAQTVSMYKLDKHELFYYASNRWYNFWSAMAVEQLFIETEGVAPAENSRDNEKDFLIHGIPFDHKTSIFPRGFVENITYAKNNELELLNWLYKHQSKQNRFHLKNRLFIIVHDTNGNHWKLKAELSLIAKSIQDYMKHFEKDQLQKVIFAENQHSFSDIIWIQK